MVSQLHDENLEQDPRVRALLAAAGAPTEPGPVPGEQEALAAFRSAQSRTRRISMPSSLTPVRAAVAAGLGAGLLLAGGVGAAAAGVLPGAAQDTARTWLDTVGVQVPGPDEHAAGHADQRGRSAEAGPADAETEAPAESTDTSDVDEVDDTTDGTDKELPAASEHGQTVSGTARETEAEGADKGAEVSDVASEGRSRAGENTAPEASDDEGDESADADETADAGAEGRAKADEASGDRRTDGGATRP